MKYNEVLLFIFIALVSGLGWLLVPSQVESIHPLFSVSYRFIIAGIFLIIISIIKDKKLFDHRVLPLIFLQGLFTFPLNYFLTYSAVQFTSPDLVSLISSLVIIPSFLIGVFNKEYIIHKNILFGLIGAIIGVILISYSGIKDASLNLYGLGIAVLSIVSTAIGFSFVKKVKRDTEISIVSITGQSMFIGGIISLGLAVIFMQKIEIILSVEYLGSLSVLVILTPLVFVSFNYFTARYSATMASYIWVIAPIFSVLGQVIIEGEAPDFVKLMGSILIIMCGIYMNYKMQRKG